MYGVRGAAEGLPLAAGSLWPLAAPAEDAAAVAVTEEGDAHSDDVLIHHSLIYRARYRRVSRRATLSSEALRY
jgi:hypothetical protein